MPLRVLSYNVRSLRDSRADLVGVIRAARPDLVCLQEAPRFLLWRSRLAALACETGLVVVGGGPAAGANALLASMRVRVRTTTCHLFSSSAGLHQRGAVIAVVDEGAGELAVAGTHLGLDPAERERHAAELLAALRATAPGLPYVVGADLNDVPGSPAWQQLLASSVAVEGGPTFPARAPTRRIDAVLASASLRPRPVELAVAPTSLAAASDHLPVLAEVG